MHARNLQSEYERHTTGVRIVDKPEWITVTDAAKIMDITEESVRRLCRQEKIKAQKFGHVWMIDKESAGSYEKTVGGRGHDVNFKKITCKKITCKKV